MTWAISGVVEVEALAKDRLWHKADLAIVLETYRF
jgi:hypothetical protein